MGIQEFLCWYQKKIGTYDKQQWEKTIEQRILHGLTHIHPMKTKPPKTEFIDLDLVRGSSFPKAKPKHGLVTVTRLATLRLFLLPLFSRWWVEQTSIKVFALLLMLYILQLLNICVYFHHSCRSDPAVEYVSSSEIIIPMCMMFILSIIHSQIVSTQTGPEKLVQNTKSRKSKIRRRRVHYANIRSRNISPETKSSTESSIDPTEKPFREATLRRFSAEQIRNRNVRNELEKKEEPRKKNSNKVNVINNVKFNLNNISVQNIPAPATPMDDDGFESFNGYGSSENGDETVTENEVNNSNAVNSENKSECSNANALDLPTNTVVTDVTVKTNVLNEMENIVICGNDYSSGEQSDAESDSGNRRIRSSDKERVTQSLTETANTSTTEYLGITTNSEECSYSSEYDESDSQNEMNNNDNIMWDYDLAPTVILSPSCAPSDRVSCTIWENRDIKKADLSVLDISSAIIARVETMPETPDYFYTGVVLSILLALLPPICRLSESAWDSNIDNEIHFSIFELYSLIVKKFAGSIHLIFDAAFGKTGWERTVMIIALIERGSLACLFFFLLAVAERTFKQRFLYAKLFSHLTSSRRARKSELPHFRLNKVRNIKTWLSVRSYLKRRGPQRSVDVIVSTAFIITLLLLSFISMLLLKDSFVTIHSQYNFEAVVWCLGLGVFLLRFMTLGTKINRKNRNLSVLITEQINLYLQIEQKPHKKDKLMVANSVLKLAADLLKDPIPNEPWSGVRKAVNDSPVCTQRNPYTRSTIFEGEEDCLYLNVYTPELPSFGSNPLPVMVFFHGGGWVCGAGTSMWYGPDILLDREVVLVVPNFRLGPLGFLSTQDNIVPGNMGMKDQVLVLKWIQKNIAAFGGDPNSVTIFGESAGGASVHLHMLSSMSKGLFHRGISQSGTALCSWAFAPEGEPRNKTEKLAKSLNCPTTSSVEMINCLRKIEAQDIIKKDHVFWDWDFDPMIPFKPMVEHKHDGAFLTEHPRKLIMEGKINNVPWITGVTSNEGALRVAGIFGNPHLLEEFAKDFNKIAPISLFYAQTSPEPDTVTSQIKKFYFGDKDINNNMLQEVVDLYTDGWFLSAADESVKLHLKYGSSPIYFYYFNHRGVASFSEIFGDPHRNYGVCHADDLQYLFPVGDGLFPDKPQNDADKRVSEIISNMWANFARNGNPNYENNEVDPFIWKPVSTNKLEYLHIKSDTEFKMDQSLLMERTKFWENLPLREDMNTLRKLQDEL